MRNCGIYKIENLVNGNVYIGQTCQMRERWPQHYRLLRRNKHYNFHLQKSWNKYGESNFIFKVILICEEADLTYYEQKLVDIFNPKYNERKICVNSNLGMKHSKETKSKISLSHTGMIFSEEHKRNLSESHKGKPSSRLGKHHTEESNIKNSEAHKGEKNSRFGKYHSEETKAKMSEAQKGDKSYWKGKHQSKETIDKRIISLKESWARRKEKNDNLKDSPQN